MRGKVTVGVRANEGTVAIGPAELERWAEQLGLHQLVPGRFSSVLVMDLLILRRQGVHERAVLDEIRALEAGVATSTKAPTPFERNPVLAQANIWHKHFTCSTPNMIISNALAEIGHDKGVNRLVDAMFETTSGAPTAQDFAALADRLVIDSYFERHSRRALTGEWLIYTPRPSGNLYLGACPHSTGDKGLEKRLAIWRLEFPDLVRNDDNAQAENRSKPK